MMTLGVLGILFFLYGLGVVFYQNHFLPTTRMSGVSVGNQSVELAEAKLREGLNGRKIKIVENGVTLGELNLSGIETGGEVSADLVKFQGQQSAFAWPFVFFQQGQYDYALSGEAVNLSDEYLQAALMQLGVDNTQRVASSNAYLSKTESGFRIVPDQTGTQIDLSQIREALLISLNEPQPSVDLSQHYQVASIRQDDEMLQKQSAQADKIVGNSITLKFDGKSETITGQQIYEWVSVGESGLEVDREAIEEYLRQLNYTHSGLFNGRYFDSTYSGKVWIDPGTYGWYIDRVQEKDKLAEEILRAEKIERDAIVGGSGYGMGDSVGNSYVEVSIDHQMMWIYIEGKLALETPIVTGRPGTNTIPGAYQVWNMETPSVLKGYNPHTNVEYQQPVDYWIAFDDQAQGIHDANWQSTFGGGAYLSNGSLGCINTPPGVMPQVYALVYSGMPVVIY